MGDFAVAAGVGISSNLRTSPLLEAARARDSRAQEALYLAHAPFVRRLLTRILGPSSDVDDLTQEVFMRAFRRIDAVETEDGLRPWLSTIAVFVAKEALRARRRKRWLSFLPTDELPEPPANGGPREESAARAFYDVVAKLPADEAIVLTLRLVDGMSVDDVAHALSLSSSMVKRRCAEARARFLRLARSHPELVEWTSMEVAECDR